jgi:hypothetical protein
MKGTGDFHETTPSFAALVEIDNKPYALKFRFSESWNDFYRLLNVRGFPPQITLIPLLDPDDVKDDISIKSSCLYEALPKQIKY